MGSQAEQGLSGKHVFHTNLAKEKNVGNTLRFDLMVLLSKTKIQTNKQTKKNPLSHQWQDSGVGLSKISAMTACSVARISVTCLGVQSLSHVGLFVTPPRTAAHQAPLCMGFPSKNTRAGCHVRLWGTFPTQDLNQRLPHWQAGPYHWDAREAQLGQ